MREISTRSNAAHQYTEVDVEARASYTYIEPFGRKVAKTEVVSESENRDYDSDGNLIGIERL